VHRYVGNWELNGQRADITNRQRMTRLGHSAWTGGDAMPSSFENEGWSLLAKAWNRIDDAVLDALPKAMTLYRLYKIDKDGHIDNEPESLDCADDHEAVKIAMERAVACTIEVWDLGRCVAKIEATHQ
jgi:hypothetical protein